MLCRFEPFLELQSWRTAFHCEVCFQSPLWTVYGAQGSGSSRIMAAPMGTESVEEILFRGKNRNCSRCRPCHCHITDDVHFLQRVRDTVQGHEETGSQVLLFCLRMPHTEDHAHISKWWLKCPWSLWKSNKSRGPIFRAWIGWKTCPLATQRIHLGPMGLSLHTCEWRSCVRWSRICFIFKTL